MKFSLAAIPFLLSTLALADQAPSWWQLPEQGKNCSFSASFGKSGGCGEKGYEIWVCTFPSNDAFTPATSKKFLVVGEYTSDTGPITKCDTFAVKETLQQK